MSKITNSSSTRTYRRKTPVINQKVPTKRTRHVKDKTVTNALLNGLTAEHVPLPSIELVKRVLSGSRRSKSRGNEPPRPPNAFFLFRNALHTHLLDQNLKVPQVSMAAGSLWETAKAETKEHYSKLQNIAKQRHLDMYPGYVYRPRRSSVVKKKNDLLSEEHQQQYQMTDIPIQHFGVKAEPLHFVHPLKLEQSFEQAQFNNNHSQSEGEVQSTLDIARREIANLPQLPPSPASSITSAETLTHSPHPTSPVSPISTTPLPLCNIKSEQTHLPDLPTTPVESFQLPSPQSTRRLSYVEAMRIAMLHHNIVSRQQQETDFVPQQQQLVQTQPQSWVLPPPIMQSPQQQPHPTITILEPQIDPRLSVNGFQSIQSNGNIFAGTNQSSVLNEHNTLQQCGAPSTTAQHQNYEVLYQTQPQTTSASFQQTHSYVVDDGSVTYHNFNEFIEF